MPIFPSRTSQSCVLLLILSSAMVWISSTGHRLHRYTLPVAGGVTKARVIAAYGKLPLSFELNEGQADSRVTFVSHGAGHTLSLTTTEALLKLDLPAQAAPIKPSTSSVNPQGLAAASIESKSAVLRMKLIGANSAAKSTGIEKLPGTSNYVIGNDPKKWLLNVPNYSRVKCQQVYSGVDLVYYGTLGQLEYDFVVAPGTDPEVIRLSFDGAERISIDEIGDLVIATSGVEIRQRKPFAYQEMNGVKTTVSARYVIASIDEVALEVAQYDHGKPLVIDPVLAYSTYIGGLDEDIGNGIAVDSDGNTFITGRTKSSNFPTTAGGFQTTKSSFDDAFVLKLDPTGSSIVYSTFIGGSGFDEADGIAVDVAGNAYITGTTTSRDFPTTPGAFQVIFGPPPQHVFVTKVSSTGAILGYSTYLGGSGIDDGFALAVDTAGNAHVTGLTTSRDFPITAGAFQTDFRGGRIGSCEFGDAFVTKLNATGTDILYSTYLGGRSGEVGLGIALDNTGDAYVTGATGSDDFPTSQGAFQTNRGGCLAEICESNLCEDAFVTKLNPTGTGVVYSSYLGGIVGDVGFGIAVDFARHALVTGATNSFDFPRANPIQTTFGGFRDVFVTKVNPTGSALVFSTFLGSGGDEEGLGIAVDTGGDAFVTGHTTSTDFPTLNPLRPYAGNRDAFVLKIGPSGLMMYSTHLGGSNAEGILSGGIAVDTSGAAYLTGTTRSTDFPTTAGAFQRTYGGGLNDIFIAKISDTPRFDICVQDESNGNLLQVNSTTGNYQFTSCGSVAIGGTGAITRRGCLVTLQVNGPDRRLLARIDTCMNSGFASIQVFSQSVIFTILDRNTANNTCTCSR